jgi:hypothetical protein
MECVAAQGLPRVSAGLDPACHTDMETWVVEAGNFKRDRIRWEYCFVFFLY